MERNFDIEQIEFLESVGKHMVNGTHYIDIRWESFYHLFRIMIDPLEDVNTVVLSKIVYDSDKSSADMNHINTVIEYYKKNKEYIKWQSIT